MKYGYTMPKVKKWNVIKNLYNVLKILYIGRCIKLRYIHDTHHKNSPISCLNDNGNLHIFSLTISPCFIERRSNNPSFLSNI